MTWTEAKAESDRIKAEAAAKGETLFLWPDGARAGDILATMNGYTVRIQGPPIPPGRRRCSGGL